MKFRIRFAYQIVGILSGLAAALLLFIIFVLGSAQRWFVRDISYRAYFESAAGLSVHMPALYRGFTIGQVKNFALAEDDRVEVTFTIFNNYADRVREGSLVDLQLSPIGLGNKFVFYSGQGNALWEEGHIIPTRHSPDGQEYIRRGLASVPAEDDTINGILNGVNDLAANLNRLILGIEEALAGGRDNSLGRILGNAEEAASDLSLTMEELRISLEGILGDLKPVAANLKTFSESLSDPSGAVGSILNVEGSVYRNLDSSLNSIALTLGNLENSSRFLPTQLPQLGAAILELRIALKSAQDVLTALSNNPLLRGGVPKEAPPQAAGTSARDVSF